MIEGLPGPGACREEKQVHRGPDRVCAEAERTGHERRGGVPQDGHQRGDVLCVEEEVQRRRAARAATIAPARRGEPPAQADRRGPEPGQGDAAGGRRKKSLRPSYRRELVPELMQRFGCSERNALRIVRMSASTYRYTSTKRDESALKLRIKEITNTRVHYGYRRVHVL